MTQRIIVLILLFLSCAYGVKQIHDGFNRKYFIVALCGVTAILLARIYYMVILISDGDDNVLTIGTLGQSSAYLFFMTANLRFLSHELKAKCLSKVHVPAAIATFVLCIIFLIPAVMVGTLAAYVGQIIYMLSMCGAFYTAVNFMSYRKEYIMSEAVFPFNVCVCILVLVNALSELINAGLTIGTAEYYVAVIAVMILTVPALVLMIPLLRKGMEKWKT